MARGSEQLVKGGCAKLCIAVYQIFANGHMQELYLVHAYMVTYL